MTGSVDLDAQRLVAIRVDVARQRSEWIELWRDLVDIDSGPGDVAGIERVYERLTPVLASLGFDVATTATDGGPDVLLGTEAARAAGCRRVLLVGHVDTVFPAPAAGERPFTIADGRAHGPGVADMKGGVVLALAAIAALTPGERQRLDLTVLLNGDEESASVASRPVIEQAAKDADVALVFESGRPGGQIVVGRRGAIRIDVDVVGVAAHSGVAPDAGANAAVQAAHHIVAIEEFDRQRTDLSLTVTILHAGGVPNIVPSSARIHLDGRFDTAAGGAAIVDFVALLAGRVDVERTTTSWRVLNERPAFPLDGANDELAACYLVGAAALGVEASTVTTGGSSDGNFAAALGVPTLDGLGPVGHGYHTADEWSDVDSLVDRAAITAGVLEALGRTSDEP